MRIHLSASKQQFFFTAFLIFFIYSLYTTVATLRSFSLRFVQYQPFRRPSHIPRQSEKQFGPP